MYRVCRKFPSSTGHVGDSFPPGHGRFFLAASRLIANAIPLRERCNVSSDITLRLVRENLQYCYEDTRINERTFFLRLLAENCTVTTYKIIINYLHIYKKYIFKKIYMIYNEIYHLYFFAVLKSFILI